jgi:hypothetical protein
MLLHAAVGIERFLINTRLLLQQPIGEWALLE